MLEKKHSPAPRYPVLQEPFAPTTWINVPAIPNGGKRYLDQHVTHLAKQPRIPEQHQGAHFHLHHWCELGAHAS